MFSINGTGCFWSEAWEVEVMEECFDSAPNDSPTPIIL
jgi:hypothetical protein